jgi:sulfide:quinone oxidoreductase
MLNTPRMKKRIVVLGAGFGGMELTTLLSEQVAGDADITLIDQGDSFVFGYSKLDVMFRGASPEAVRLPYAEFVKPGVNLVRDTVTAIDPERRHVTTWSGSHDADILVIALGAEYDYAATPGLTEEHEFYSYAGAFGMRAKLEAFTGGSAVIGVCGAPFKCPPAPSECALMLHDSLLRRGIRDRSEITLVLPFMTPVPPSPDTSAALVSAFAERGITFVPSTKVKELDHDRGAVLFESGDELAFDLFLGVPKHRAPEVVLASGLAVDGSIPVDSATLATAAPGVYAIGDVATQGTPKAGVFAEGAAKALAATLIGEIRGTGATGTHTGKGSCYIEFGADRIGRVDVDFLSGPSPTGVFQEPSETLRILKEEFGSSRRARWFGRTT